MQFKSQYSVPVEKKGEKYQSFRKRWNARAETWDEEIKSPEHYANFEQGYKAFIDFSRKKLENVNFSSTIEVGCGTAEASIVVAEKAKDHFLLDISEEMLKIAQEKYPKAHMLHASATDIPLPDKSVEVAISRGVLISHLPSDDYSLFLNELERIVCDGGIIVFDFLANMNTINFATSSVKTVLTREQMKEELESRGFKDIEFDGDETKRVIRVSAKK